MRMRVALAVSCILLTGLSAAEPAAANITKETHIPAQPLATALEAFAKDWRLQLVYVTAEVEAVRSAGAVGNLSAADAMRQLLHGTGLTYRFLNDNTVTVQRGPPVQPTTMSLAPADAGQSSASGSAVGDSSGVEEKSSGYLEEVVVTAEKKSERLQDVPIPVTSVRSDALAERNQFRLQDYSTQVPGLSLTSNDGAGAPMIAIRGIAPASFGNPTVGVMIDDVPFGSSNAFGGGFVTPELDPADLARIEVLRGPQGTLYGAASMGGLLKYVTLDPSTDALKGRIQAGVSSVHNATDVGFNVSGGINAPINDTLAIRASGFTRREPGYIDNIQGGERSVNETHVDGGHMSALWRPSELFSLKLSVLYQRNEQRGEPLTYHAPGLKDLQHSFMPDSGTVDREFSAYSATATANLGLFDLTSVTGYNVTDLLAVHDNTFNLGEVTALVFPFANTLDSGRVKTSKLTQEIRLRGPLGEHFELLFGGFYTHEKSPTETIYTATDPQAQPIGQLGLFTATSKYAESAVFADLTYRLNDRFDVQLGARESQMKQRFSAVDSGVWVELVQGMASPDIYPNAEATDSAFTYLLTPRFKITPDVMLYARFASGFRPGGVNQGFVPDGLPRNFKPDETLNYEVGVKGDALDRKVSFDFSVYHIDWQDIQTSLLNPDNSFSYYSNGGEAQSRGVELSAQLAPVRGLRIGAWAAWNDAVLTRDMPENSVTIGLDGDRLPFTSRLSASASVEYEFPLSLFDASLGAIATYVGDRIGPFQPSPERQKYPAYTTTDVRAGLTLDSWRATFYLNNVTDRRGLVGGGLGSYFPDTFAVIQPRTLGLSVTRTF